MTRHHRVLLPVLCIAVQVIAGCGQPEPEEPTGPMLGVALERSARPEPLAVRAQALQGYCDSVTTWDPAWVDFEAEVLAEVNRRRAAGATCGGVARRPVPALTLDSRLRCAARLHSQDMATKAFFSHTGSNGSTFVQRIQAAGYSFTAAGENIAAGQTTPASVVQGWMNSTGHCNNIMNPNYTQLGVGYYRGGPYGHYWTQDFGRP